MSTYIRKRCQGPVWRKSIFIEENGRHFNGILEGENMNNIRVYIAIYPNQQKGELISEGRLRVVPSYDQGSPASYLIYQPNKRRYHNQERVLIMRVV